MTTASQELATTNAALPEPVTRRGVNEAQWRTLCTSLYPGANPQSVLMVIDYCQARRLDPLKKPCHIVPMEVKDAKTGNYSWRDVVMPGIYEIRTTAQRTGEYLGHEKAEYGPPVDYMGVSAPEYCDFTVKRWNTRAQMVALFPVRVMFAEVVAVTKDKRSQEWKANSRWSKAPFQMLTKCAEAASLREAFPDELGGEQTAEEMDGQRAVDVQVLEEKPTDLVKPDGYAEWLAKLSDAAKQGEPALLKAWEESPQVCRTYLTATEPDAWEDYKLAAREAENQL